MSVPESVLAFWIGPEPKDAAELQAKGRMWFGGGAAVDDEVRAKFGALTEEARRGALDGWTDTPRGTLALIVLLDQFSRNLYRGSADAFSCDGKALALAAAGYDAGRFADFSQTEHMFAVLPFQHAEDLAMQRRGVALSVEHALAGPPHLKDFLVNTVDWARKHLDVVARFGRFPHRNAALGRTSTPEEAAYLAYLKLAGQWL